MTFDGRAPGTPAAVWSADSRFRDLPALALRRTGRTVVVAAHPDDETLGAGGILAELVYHQNLSGFWATFFANASVTDLWGSVVKTTMFGAIIAIVCCYKGMTASGGAAGVGRAVNEAVVIAFAGIWAFNYVFTQTLLATHPEILVIR